MSKRSRTDLHRGKLWPTKAAAPTDTDAPRYADGDAKTYELVREICRRCESRPGGITCQQAEALANILLKAFGPNPDYPCHLHDSTRQRGIAAATARAEERLVATDTAAPAGDEGILSDPLALLLPVLVKTGLVPLYRGTGDPACADQGQCSRKSGAGAPADADAPHYTVVRSRRLPCGVPSYLLPLIANLLVEAKLTPRQRQVSRRMFWGWRVSEIAQDLGIAASTVHRLWTRARKSLGEALVKMVLARARAAATPAGAISTADIAEVYRRELRRRGYIRPRHCPRGKECCRKDGVCQFAILLTELAGAQERG